MEKFKIKPNHNSEYNWYVWYTKPRAEKKVRDRLVVKGLEVFLPLNKELRQWSDRKKWVEAPLFSGYIFSYISQREWDTVCFTEGILTYVRSEGKPAIIRQNQIDQIRCVLKYSETSIVAEDAGLLPGELIEIVAGPFAGMHGEMINYKGSYKLAIRIEHLEKVMLVHLPVNYIKSLKRA
ncbi:MAG: UpxY family transcription antiterminator [Bacteroidia bacterium]